MKKFLIIVVIATGILGAWFWLSPVNDLQRVGYSRDEAKRFTSVLDRQTTKKLLKKEYSAEYIKLIEAPEFKTENFLRYIDALEKNNLSPEDTVYLVNHPDYDEAISYDLKMLEIMREKYYLSNRRERYFELRENPDLTTQEMVALVNANRDREFYQETAPANLNDGYLMLVNKYYYLTEDFVPKLEELGAEYGTIGVLLEPTAKAEFLKMYHAALEAGFRLYVTSGYRGYGEQAEVYHSWVVTEGEENAKEFAALPGYSEHQTGLSLDVFTIGETTTSFAGTPAANWLKENAWHYGFILRYPETAENLTGYNSEAWHFRYVGHEAAEEIFTENLTLEEYWAIKNPAS